MVLYCIYIVLACSLTLTRVAALGACSARRARQLGSTCRWSAAYIGNSADCSASRACMLAIATLGHLLTYDVHQSEQIVLVLEKKQKKKKIPYVLLYYDRDDDDDNNDENDENDVFFHEYYKSL